MFCIKCGSPMQNGELFCIRCGAKQIPDGGMNPTVPQQGMPGQMMPQYAAQGMPGQPMPPYGAQGMPGQPMSPYGAQGMPGQPMPPYGAQGMPGQPIPPYGAQNMPGQPMSPYGAQNMPGQPMSPYGAQNMPGQPVQSPIQNAAPQAAYQASAQNPSQSVAQTAPVQQAQTSAQAAPQATPSQSAQAPVQSVAPQPASQPSAQTPVAQAASSQSAPQQPIQAAAQTASSQSVQPSVQTTSAQASTAQAAPSQPAQTPATNQAPSEPAQAAAQSAYTPDDEAVTQQLPNNKVYTAAGITQTADIFSTNAKTEPAVTSIEPSTQTVLPPEGGKKKKFPWWIIAIAAGVLLLAGAAGVFLYFRSSKIKEQKAEEERLEAIQQLFDNADGFYESKKYEQAIAEYKDVLNEELTAGDIERAYLGIAKSYVGMAGDASEKGDYDKALEYYTEAENALANVDTWETYEKKKDTCVKDIEKGKKKAEELKESGKAVASEEPPVGGAFDPYAYLPETGDTLSIYVWNDEWKNFFWQYMPGATSDSYDYSSGRYSDTGTLGNLNVVFHNVTSSDGAYQKAVDDAIKNGEDIDIFLVEADYAKKYTVPGVAVPIKDLGITDADLADQYAYTQQVVTTGGVLYGSSWQTCIGGMIYDRAIARQVLGTDDPASVQAMVSDWSSYEEVAAKMKKAGYMMTPRTQTTYRVFSNNMTSPWIVNGQINMDPSIEEWIEMSKSMVGAKQTVTGSVWDDWDANSAFYKHKAFCVFGPAWYFNFCMGYDPYDGVESIADTGEWGLCEGPEAHFWGGTWLCVSTQSDNQQTCADVIKTMTLDKGVLMKLVEEQSQDPNSMELMAQYANDASFGNTILGGQNPYSIFAEAGKKINVSTMTENDQYFNEQIQLAMDKYFDGQLSYDQAYAEFEQKVKSYVPGLN